VDVATRCLDPAKYEVRKNPRDLARIFDDHYGVTPEASITSLKTGRAFFVEVKKQGDRGNAEERAMKHHTVQFYKTLKDYFGYPYHPYVTVFCESLAVNPRYTVKFRYYLEQGQYFLWVGYREDLLCEFLRGRCAAWLDAK
jgi:hypothetical protein